ncbi:hypothetical protein BIT28_06095 [Photobacterium proteolyticum]|uniref:Uncharacterized protein n=1 Tax=Photobacterium proteolyticum TaxID=1903952 RepID=A0A1Q9GED6_9GAMM|nr:hypothetical protein [Photobacterium proteolyticum]OLQ72761.1 hypothetical protein BIT28_06095 [Photobacterium proteolyticum]
MSINVTVLCLALAAIAFDYIANRDGLNSEPQLQYVNDTGSSELNVDQEPFKIDLPPRGVVLGAVYVGQ